MSSASFSGSSSGSGSSSNCSSPYYGPFLSPKEERGTARILKYAKENKWLEWHGGSTVNPKVVQVSQRIAAPIESAVKATQLEIMKYLDPKSVCRLSRASHNFHDLKGDSLKKRGDVVSDLIRYLKGNLKNPFSGDKEVLKTIRSLDLSGISMSPAKMVTIVKLCPALQEIDLTCCDVIDGCLAALIPLKNQLTSLKLADNFKITDRGLRNLAGFTSLKRLIVAAQSNDVFATLATLTQLESVEITRSAFGGGDGGVEITEDIMERLASTLGGLKELIFGRGVVIKEEAVMKCSLFTKLEILKLPFISGKAIKNVLMLKEIGKITNLKELEVGKADLDGLEPLMSLTHLQKLSFLGLSKKAEDGLHALLPSLPQLTEFMLYGGDFEEEELIDILARCSKLTALRFYAVNTLTGSGFDSLSSLPELKTIEFASCKSLNEYVFIDLAHCKALKNLVFSNCPGVVGRTINDGEALNLQSLELRDCKDMQLAGVRAYLAKCPQLQKLVISNMSSKALKDEAKIGGSLIDLLMPLSQTLREIKIVSGGISATDYKKLAQFSHLEVLTVIELGGGKGRGFDNRVCVELGSGGEFNKETKQFLKAKLPNLVIMSGDHTKVVMNNDEIDSDSDSRSSDSEGSDTDHGSDIDASGSDNDSDRSGSDNDVSSNDSNSDSSGSDTTFSDSDFDEIGMMFKHINGDPDSSGSDSDSDSDNKGSGSGSDVSSCDNERNDGDSDSDDEGGLASSSTAAATTAPSATAATASSAASGGSFEPAMDSNEKPEKREKQT